MKNKTLLSLMIAIGLSTISISTASAQTINRNQQNDPFQSNEQNPLYGDGFNPMQLIHNANMMNNRRSGGAFSEDSNRNIDNAARSFREQQLQRIMEMQQNQNRENEIESQDNL